MPYDLEISLKRSISMEISPCIPKYIPKTVHNSTIQKAKNKRETAAPIRLDKFCSHTEEHNKHEHMSIPTSV